MDFRTSWILLLLFAGLRSLESRVDCSAKLNVAHFVDLKHNVATSTRSRLNEHGSRHKKKRYGSC